MKRYLLFRGRDYYPSGGIDDLVADFDTLDESVTACRKDVTKDFDDYKDMYERESEYFEYQMDYSWGYVYDTETRQKVWDQIELVK